MQNTQSGLFSLSLFLSLNVSVCVLKYLLARQWRGATTDPNVGCAHQLCTLTTTLGTRMFNNFWQNIEAVQQVPVQGQLLMQIINLIQKNIFN